MLLRLPAQAVLKACMGHVTFVLISAPHLYDAMQWGSSAGHEKFQIQVMSCNIFR